MTQTSRLLAALTRAGDRGVTSVDFIRTPTIDGGPPILRLAARVKELRDEGFNVVTDGERDSVAVYKLEPADSGQLFPVSFDEAIPPRPRNAILGDEAA